MNQLSQNSELKESKDEIWSYNSEVVDVFLGYGLSPVGLTQSNITRLLDEISKIKKTFSYIQSAIKSNRHPYQIMFIAAEIGMYIPPRKRVGIEAYQFFINNVRYYEATYERPLPKDTFPTIQQIYMANNRVEYLMKFRDDEILRQGFKFSRNYSTRPEMIDNFILNNVMIYGEFKLDNTSRRSYSSKAKVITYTEPSSVKGQLTKIQYNTTDLFRFFDINSKIVWKDPVSKIPFHKLSLLGLRQQILEKFSQWRIRDGYSQFNGPADLYQLLVNLESILSNENRNDSNAYLGSPVF